LSADINVKSLFTFIVRICHHSPSAVADREDVEELELVEPGPLDGRSTAADGGEVLPEVNGHANGVAGAGGGGNGGGACRPKPPDLPACKRSADAPHVAMLWHGQVYNKRVAFGSFGI